MCKLLLAQARENISSKLVAVFNVKPEEDFDDSWEMIAIAIILILSFFYHFIKEMTNSNQKGWVFKSLLFEFS